MNNITKNNKFSSLFVKFLAIFAIVAGMDYFVGSLLDHYYFKQKAGLYFRTTYSLEKTDANVVVFGASCANHHYSPEIFEPMLGMSFYNTGRDGCSILYHQALLNGILKRYRPKIVILDVNPDEFEYNSASYGRLSSLLPYYRTHQEIHEIVELRNPYEKYKLLSRIYPFNSMLLTIVAGNLESNIKRRPDNKGYVPLSGNWHAPVKLEKVDNGIKIDPNKIKAYTDFLKSCNAAGVRAYVVVSPTYNKTASVDTPSLAKAREIAATCNVRFLNLIQHGSFVGSQKYFKDAIHLNDSGARYFSTIIARNVQ